MKLNLLLTLLICSLYSKVGLASLQSPDSKNPLIGKENEKIDLVEQEKTESNIPNIFKACYQNPGFCTATILTVFASAGIYFSLNSGTSIDTGAGAEIGTGTDTDKGIGTARATCLGLAEINNLNLPLMNSKHGSLGNEDNKVESSKSCNDGHCQGHVRDHSELTIDIARKPSKSILVGTFRQNEEIEVCHSCPLRSSNSSSSSSFDGLQEYLDSGWH